MGTGRVAVLFNDAAGNAQAEEQLQQIREAFVRSGAEARIWRAGTEADIDRAAREAFDLDFPVIAAAGGDGTVSRAAALLAGTGRALGVLPTGTLNHFAKDLNIPPGIPDAVGVITRGHSVDVDVGRVNDRIFINNVSIGIYPRILKFRERLQRQGLPRWPAFFRASIDALVRPRAPLRVRLLIGERSIKATSYLIFIGNNEYEIEGLQIGSRGRLNEHVLSLYLASRTTRPGLMGLLLRSVLGRLRRGKGRNDFETFRAQELWIDAERNKLETGLDGELSVLRPPLHFTVQPAGLKVLVG